MKLHIIGSRSDGNAYVLQNADEALLLEAGLPFSKTLEALDYQINKVVGCLVSHEHEDHASYTASYLNYGVRVIASRGTIQGIRERWLPKRVMRQPEVLPYDEAGEFQQFSLGGFTIIPFGTIHSTPEPTGFYIHHADIGTMLFATDTAYLPRPFAGLNNVMIEANYDQSTLDEALRTGATNLRKYIHVRNGHMCIDTAIQALQANDTSRVNNIVLLHLSEENADPEDFQRRVHLATGKTTYVAEPGMVIDFNATPF